MVEFLDKTGLRYLWGKIKATFYQKPSGGIPKSDLSSAVQTSLGKADTALQSHQDISGKVDKVTSTDNAVVRFDGTSGAVQNSGVTIDDSNNVKAAKFITSGGTTSHVVRGDGSLAASKELPQYEAYLEWGGKNFNSGYGPIDAAMVSELGACRTMFARPAGIEIEYSTDGGATWLDYGASDGLKKRVFSTGESFATGKNTVAGGGSANNMLRITLHTSAAGVYTVLNKFVMYVSTNGSQGSYCTIRCRTQQNYEDGVDTWVTMADKVSIGGWSGYNVINITPITTYGNVKSSQYGEWQFIFGYTSCSNDYPGLVVRNIFGFGGLGWTTPSTMAKTGHLYSFDYDQNATFPANVTAVAFKKTGGTSSQFLKADGSVDSNTYLTQSTFNSGNPDLKAIEALSGTTGLLKKTAANTWTLDTSGYLTSSDLPAAITDTEMDSVLTEVEEEEDEVVSE